MTVWAETLEAVEHIAFNDPDPVRQRKAVALLARMTQGSGSMAAISVRSGFVLHDVQKPDGAGWAEHNAIEEGDG